MQTIRRIMTTVVLLRFCLSGARERMNPFKPFSVYVPFDDVDKMMVHISWNYSSDGSWKLRHHLSMEHGRSVPLPDEQLRELTTRLENAYDAQRTLDPVFFNRKQRRWRRGWVRSPRCGSLEPYWDKFNLSLALWNAYSVLTASDLPRSKVLVNIGAGDGPGAGQSLDPVWVLALSFHLHAVFVEPGPAEFQELNHNIKAHRTPLNLISEPYMMALKPEQIPNLLQRSALLQSAALLDVLKVDIDVNDCDVAASFLRERRARIVLIEVNPSFPPPILFCQHASSPPHANTKPLHGCSLSYMVELFATFDMWLYRFDGQDALFVDSALARELTAAFGDRFPKDEIDCFQWPRLLPSTASAPVDEFRNWFYDLEAEEQLQIAARTAMSQYARYRGLCSVEATASCSWHEAARGVLKGPAYRKLIADSQAACKHACCDDSSCHAASFSWSAGGMCMLHKQVHLHTPRAESDGGVVLVRREARDEKACMEAFQSLQPQLPMTIGLPICGHSCQFPSWPSQSSQPGTGSEKNRHSAIT
ncbi:unnamed protein product [Symbiodinium natans]|uniref:Apple domain-containing protein n=1 Tax=Symbiodinium natans TaxID=878477 RepID=A0A812TUA5_9DINO|nr:unnamed protein product [Symbiodinium natans]